MIDRFGICFFTHTVYPKISFVCRLMRLGLRSPVCSNKGKKKEKIREIHILCYKIIDFTKDIPDNR
jgi:hypothetical protein